MVRQKLSLERRVKVRRGKSQKEVLHSFNDPYSDSMEGKPLDSNQLKGRCARSFLPPSDANLRTLRIWGGGFE